jgi:hypothetical protein
MAAYREQWINCLVQGQNDIFLPCQLGDSIKQPFGHWPNALMLENPSLTRLLPFIYND